MAEAHTPRFSIVVPAYNAAATLSETLDAVLTQEWGDWECILVDDGSSDGTLDIARVYERADVRFRVLHQANAGTAGAYNTGVAAARGDFVVICSADDVLLPEHLAHFAAFIDRHGDSDIYSSNGYYWRLDGSRRLADNDSRSRVSHSRSLEDVIRVCFYSVGAAFRRELFVKAGGFRQVFGEDYDFWLRAMATGARHRYIPEPLSLFRLSPAQKSSQLERMYRSDIDIVTDLAKTVPLSERERRAVHEAVEERIRLIEELHSTPLRYLRTVVGPLALRLVGRRVALRGWRMIRAVARVTRTRQG